MGRAKDIAELLRTVGGKKNPRYFTSAIILAAGNSERMKSETPKQFMDLCGMPVIVHSLLAYEKCPLIHEIIVVCRGQGDFDIYEEFKNKYNITKPFKIVSGDQTRQLSVIKGLERVDKKTDFVAIADGARCLTTPEMITRVCRYAFMYDAATAATRSQDTVKRVKNGFITETVPRNEVWLAQTPQVFKLNLYRAAAYSAIESGNKSATDDNSLVEAIGRSVMTVECGKENIKITTPEDLLIAAAILSMRADKPENS